MRKIRKYFLVVGTVHDGPHGFTDRVWKMIEKGFEPLGGVAITSRPINGRPCEIFAQAMALYDDAEMDPNLEAYLAEQTAEASTVAGSTRSPAIAPGSTSTRSWVSAAAGSSRPGQTNCTGTNHESRTMDEKKSENL